MANQPIMKGIIKNVSLLAYAMQNGRMSVGTFHNKVTGEEFRSCAFTNPTTGEVKFVNFSSNLGELTPQEIAAQKHDLQVVTLDGGNDILCRKGENSWESVELGL